MKKELVIMMMISWLAGESHSSGQHDTEHDLPKSKPAHISGNGHYCFGLAYSKGDKKFYISNAIVAPQDASIYEKGSALQKSWLQRMKIETGSKPYITKVIGLCIPGLSRHIDPNAAHNDGELDENECLSEDEANADRKQIAASYSSAGYAVVKIDWGF